MPLSHDLRSVQKICLTSYTKLTRMSAHVRNEGRGSVETIKNEV